MVAKCLAAIRGKSITKDELQMAYQVGWIQEMLQAYAFAIDEFMDKDTMGWCRPTWYAKRNNDTEYLLEMLLQEEI